MQTPGDSEGQEAGRAAVHRGHKESDMTERVNNNNDKGGIIYNGEKESLASGVGKVGQLHVNQY